MTKFRWNESMNMFRDHVDPEKEEQQKQIIIETGAKVERIMKLVKSVKSGDKEVKQRNRSEVISLIEDVYKQYQSMCALYQDLKEGVKRKCNDEEDKEDNESISSSNSLGMESAGYYSPGSGLNTPNIYQPKVASTTDGQSMKSENSCRSLEELSAESSYNLVKETDKSPLKMKVLEDKVSALKVEIDTVNCQKSDHEQEFKGRHDRFHKRMQENIGLQFVSALQEKDENVLKKVDECEKFFNNNIEESMDRVQNLKNFLYGKEKELEILRIQNQESEMKLEKKTKEASDSLNLQETLTEKLKQKTTEEEGLVEERNSLKEQVKDLEIKVETLSNANRLSTDENKNQIAAPESKAENVKDLSNKMKSLQQKFESLEKNEQRNMLVNKLNPETKSSIQTTIKKMGEIMDEFRQKSEDSVRILNRRVCVAEQLNNETRAWYKNTREQHEQDKKDNELAFHSIKIIMSGMSETLSVSETFGLRFAECCEEFSNRVSKVSCEINFVRDWVKGKNGALVQVKADFDALVVQLGDKEEEILWSRQKALKLENKLRDMEKIMKENDEAMIVLKEEKREAIRQLCIWIDHHCSRSDFHKKAFFELVARYQRSC